MAVYQENFLSIRKLYPRVSERLPSTPHGGCRPGFSD